MSRPIIIGIHGKARSGKDTLANLYYALIPGCYKLSFADPIKDGVALMLGMSREDMDAPNREKKIKEFGFSVREALQVVGTEAGRKLHRDIWVRLTKLRISKLPDNTPAVIIPDVRFTNEAKYIRKNGVLIHVIRPKQGSVGLEGHESEKGIKPIEGDIVMNNHTTLDQFLIQAEQLLPSVLDNARSKAAQ